MGLFSSKKETYVGTSVSRVIADEQLPSAIRNGALMALFQNADLVEAISNEMINSLGFKTERMYSYASRDYLYGLPSATIVHNATGEDVFKAVLSNATGHVPDIGYFHYGAINNLHVGWVQLFEQYGYNAETNQIDSLSVSKNAPVFLEDMVVVVTSASFEAAQPGSYNQWGISPKGGRLSLDEHATITKARKYSPHSLMEVNPLASFDHVRVHYRWEVEETETINGVVKTKTVVKKEEMLLPFTGYDEDGEYFQARYTSNGVTRMFTHLEGQPGFPELDGLFDTTQSTSGTYFPFGYLRYNKTKPSKTGTPQEWASSKKLFGRLGISYSQMVEAVHENADIGDVEQAVLTFAVPANTENEIEQRYLFDFFKRFYVESRAVGVPLSGINSYVGNLKQEAPLSISMVIQDSRFKMTLACQGIFKKMVKGVLGNKGTHHSGRGVRLVPETYLNPFSLEETTELFEVSTHYYRKQVSSEMYEEYEVVGLRMLYHIWNKYKVVGDENDKILLIPLDRRITRKYSITDREELYARSMHYVFNSVVVVKLKWYQQEWFGEVLFIVAIVISVWSMGSDGGSFASWASALGSMTASQIVYAIAVALIKGLIVRFALKIVAKMLGPEVAAILAAVVMLYGAYEGYQAGGVDNAPWAKDLLTAGNGLIQAVSDSYSDMFNHLKTEMEDFSSLVSEQSKELEAANKLLESNTYLFPFMVPGESPDDFYNRTVHSGNIGIVGFEAVSNYVETALTLPTFSTTFGEIS